MGPKNYFSFKEVEEIRKSLNFLSGEVRQQQKMILALLGVVKALRAQNAEKDKKIAILEKHGDNLGEYRWMNDIIVSGLETKPKTCARAAALACGEELDEEDLFSVEHEVIAFLKSKGIETDGRNIKALSPLK